MPRKADQSFKRELKKVADQVTARAVLAEQKRRSMSSKGILFDRRARQIPERVRNQLFGYCHEKQRQLLQATDRFKLLCCPRRTGKTTYNIFEVILHDLKFPGCVIAYIVPDSRAHAKDLFWLPMAEVNKKLDLGYTFREVEKRVITPSGTNILILGAHDADSPKRLRGNPYGLVLLDECKDFGPHFEELVVEAVLPGLGDYGGTLVLSGTPGDTFDGLFYRISTGQPEGWKVARWIKSDNTFLREEERDLEKVWQTTYAPFGLSKDSPKFRREQKAEWVREDSERAYYYTEERNGWDGELDQSKEWEYLCGIDIGKNDKLVIQPAAFSYQDENLYFLDTFGERGMFIETMCNRWRELNDRFKFVGTVVDTGGLGVMIVDDINMRYGFNWQAAQKGQGYKLGAVEQLNNDMLLGRIKSKPDTDLAKAWSRSLKSKSTGLPTHSDECDAALYLHRFSFHWQGLTPAERPRKESAAWWEEQEKQALEDAIQRKHERQRGLRAISDND
jgi:hypothetical protein